MSIEKEFFEFIENLPGGCVVGRLELFRRFEGQERRISRLLSDLKKRELILSVGRDMWQCPRQTRFGVVLASPESVVEALERNRDVTIVPNGAKILNEIGASTQLALKRQFVATKRIQPIDLGKITIEFEYRRAFATAVSKLDMLSKTEKRRVARFWVALDYAGLKYVSSEPDHFRHAFQTLSTDEQRALLKSTTGKLKWAHKILTPKF